MSKTDRDKWDGKYAGKEIPDDISPDEWLVKNIADVPPGRALELACGLGHNAIWLAEQGWDVTAVDVSAVGLDIARRYAAKGPAEVNWLAADLDDYWPRPDAYDLVVVFRFLDRLRLPAMITSALKADGLLIYESFLAAELDRPGTHIHNPAFTLNSDELPSLFPAFETIKYREKALPDRVVAQFAAQAGSHD